MTNGETGGAKAFGGVMAIFGVVCGVAALMLPLNNRMTALENLVDTHVEKDDHPSRQTTGITRAQADIQGIESRMERDNERERENAAELARLKSEDEMVAGLERVLIENLTGRIALLESRIRELETSKP